MRSALQAMRRSIEASPRLGASDAASALTAAYFAAGAASASFGKCAPGLRVGRGALAEAALCASLCLSAGHGGLATVRPTARQCAAIAEGWAELDDGEAGAAGQHAGAAAARWLAASGAASSRRKLADVMYAGAALSFVGQDATHGVAAARAASGRLSASLVARCAQRVASGGVGRGEGTAASAAVEARVSLQLWAASGAAAAPALPCWVLAASAAPASIALPSAGRSGPRWVTWQRAVAASCAASGSAGGLAAAASSWPGASAGHIAAAAVVAEACHAAQSGRPAPPAELLALLLGRSALGEELADATLGLVASSAAALGAADGAAATSAIASALLSVGESPQSPSPGPGHDRASLAALATAAADAARWTNAPESPAATPSGWADVLAPALQSVVDASGADAGREGAAAAAPAVLPSPDAAVARWASLSAAALGDCRSADAPALLCATGAVLACAGPCRQATRHAPLLRALRSATAAADLVPAGSPARTLASALAAQAGRAAPDGALADALEALRASSDRA